MNRLILAAASAAIMVAPSLSATAAFAQADTAKMSAMKAATTQAEFVPMAASAGMFEVESSKLALEKAQKADLKTFAQKMIDDHTKANTELKAAVAASPAKTDIPTMLDAKHQKMLDDLKAASGSQFDAMYMKAQMGAHDEAIGLFQGYAENGEAGPVKEFAAKTLPTLEMHKEMLMKMQSA